MKSLESYKESNNKKKSKNKNILEEDDDDEEDFITGRYEVKEDENKRLSIVNYLAKKKKKLPLLFYIFIFAVIVFFIFLIFFIVKSINKDKNYTYKFDKINKPNLSEFKYINLTFDNGLEVLLVQLGENDTAGGSIVFDTGFLNNQYDYGDLKIALNSISSKAEVSQMSSNLSDYLGNFEAKTEEYNSFFSFNILNDGFFNFLNEFKKLSYIDKDKDYEDIIQNETKKLNNTRPEEISNIDKKEKFLLEYLIYGCNNLLSENNDYHFQNKETEKIKGIMDKILQPNRVKIVLASHYKPSMIKKKFLHHFKTIINKESNKIYSSNEDETSYYNENNFKTKKVIFLRHRNSTQNHYLKINYFIDNVENEDYYKFLNKLGYFNFLKYILERKNENSLYHQLSGANNFTIKDLSFDYEIVLKKKIKFSIKIDLAPSSYYHLDEIISITYQYINILTKKIEEDHEFSNNIFKEIEHINKQNFTFTEDINDIIPFTKKLGIKLCNKRNENNFFKDNFIDNFNNEIAKNLFNQLTSSNSVIIISLDKEGANKVLNSVHENQLIDYNTLFSKTEIIRTFGINYAIIDLETNFEKNYINNNINLKFEKNEYISNQTRPISIDESNFQFATKIINKTNFREFRYLKDTRFRLPKVHISLNLLHPYYRPLNNSNEENIDCLHFEYILYMIHIKREINEKLADAIRAGNKIDVGNEQDYIYVDVFAFSDIAKKIVVEVNNIMNNAESFKNIHGNKKKLELYIQDVIDINRNEKNLKELYLLYYSLNKYLYKYYDFPLKDLNTTDGYENKCKCKYNSNPSDLYETIYKYIVIDGQIYGYYSKIQAQEIVEIFKEENNKEENFNTILSNAGLSNLNITAETFRNWILMQKLEDFKNQNKTLITHENLNHREKYTYRYIFWSDYSLSNRIKSSVFEHIIKPLNGFKIDNFTINFRFIHKNATYFFIDIKKDRNSYSTINDDIYEKIKNEILNKYNEFKDHYNSRFNIVGTRFYFLVKNTIDQQYIPIRNMENNARKLLRSDLYVPYNIEELNNNFKELKKIKYNDLSNIFKNMYFKYHIDVSNTKENI